MGERSESDFRFRGELIRGYWRSRSGTSFLLGLPAVLCAVGLVLANNWIRDASSTIPAYALRYDKAVEAGDVDTQRVILNALVQLSPGNDEYRYRLAMLKLENGDETGGAAMLRSLATRGERKAVLWTAQRDIAAEHATVASVRNAILLLQPLLAENKDDAVVHAVLGDAYIRIRQPELALPHLKGAMRLDPKYWLTYARLLSATGRPDEAKMTAAAASEALRELVASDPADVDRRVQWAHSLRTQGLLRNSAEVLSSGLELDNDNTELKGELAETLLESAIAERRGGVVNYRRFSSLLQRAYLLSTEKLDILTELSQLPLNEHEVAPTVLDRADSALQQRLKETPEDERLQRLVAWCEFKSDRIDDALARLRAVANVNPTAQLELAEMLFANEDDDAAQAELSTAISLLTASVKESSTAATRLQLARALTMAARWDEAFEVLDRQPEPGSDDRPQTDAETNGLARIQTARIRYRLRRVQELSADPGTAPQQLQLLREVLAFAPENRFAIAGLGTLASKDTDVGKDAQQLMLQMLTGGKNSLQIHVQLGTNYLEGENYPMAVRHLSQAARLAPQDPMVANNLAFAICSTENPSESDLTRALALAGKALDRLPNHPSVLRTRGAVLLKLERHEDALHDFEQSLQQEPASQLTHQYLASAYTALGNEELAEAHRARAGK